MRIKQTTPKNVVNRELDKIPKRLHELIERNLRYVGEACVNQARGYNLGTYTDQTGNLRSSVGYVLAYRGKVKGKSKFETVMTGTEGRAKGEEYALKLSRENPNGWVLVLVAGMEYASHVQLMGKDVLASAELLADRLVPTMINKLKNFN